MLASSSAPPLRDQSRTLWHIDKYKTALRDSTLAMCLKQDAVLFGAVGGPKWDDPRAAVRPEQAILGLCKGLGLFANIRPVKMYPFLANSTALKREVVKDVDMVVLRELTGGIYFGASICATIRAGASQVPETSTRTALLISSWGHTAPTRATGKRLVRATRSSARPTGRR